LRPEPDARGPIARFGVFEVDLERGEVRREGRLVPLQRHSLVVLSALLEQAGEEVSREALRRRLWPGVDFLDFENGINTAVARLRQALGDSAEAPRFIATRRGLGYRLLLPVVWARPASESHDLQLDSAGSPAELAAPSPATTPRPARGRVWLFAGTVGIAVLLGVSLLFSWRRTTSDPPALLAFSGAAPTDPLSVHAPPGENLTGSFALSPDGKWLAFVAGAETAEQSHLWLRSLDEVATRPLPGTEGAAMPFWSPDGGSVGFFAGGQLKTIDIRNGRTATITRAPRGRGGTWNAGGVILFAPNVDSGILSVAAGGGRPAPVTDVAGAASHRFPCFLPDGLHFLYLVLREDRDESEIRWGRLGGPETGRLLTAGSNAVYTRPGYLLFARGAALLAQSFDAGALRAVGPPIVVSEHVGVYGEEGPTGLGAFSVSADGALATTDVLRPPLRFSWFDRAGHRIGTGGPPGDYLSFDLAPDATHVAVSRFDSRKRSSDILTIDLRSGVETQVTDDPWPDAGVAWAPAGNRLAFTSLRDGTWAAFVRDASQGDREQRVGACSGPDGWFPDGKYVLCERASEKGVTLWKVPVGVLGVPVPVVEAASWDAQASVSPDGRWLAYTSDHATGQREVYLIRLRGSDPSHVVSLGPGASPRWRGDARELFFLSGRTLVAVPVDTRVPTPFATQMPLFEAPLPPHDSLADLHAQFAVSPDGSRFLFATPTQSEPRSAIRVVPRLTAPAPR
jgi:Tol biopolymer transport system component/DNA-binding winged helix-turn-helix (wHTH) protein